MASIDNHSSGYIRIGRRSIYNQIWGLAMDLMQMYFGAVQLSMVADLQVYGWVDLADKHLSYYSLSWSLSKHGFLPKQLSSHKR